jgi:hypothetical protein
MATIQWQHVLNEHEAELHADFPLCSTAETGVPAIVGGRALFGVTGVESLRAEGLYGIRVRKGRLFEWRQVKESIESLVALIHFDDPNHHFHIIPPIRFRKNQEPEVMEGGA